MARYRIRATAKSNASATAALIIKERINHAGDVKKHLYGKVFDVPAAKVTPKPDGWEGRLDIGNEVLMKELEEVYDNVAHERETDYEFRMISRRLSDIHNSSWHTNERLTRRFKYNPAFMNPNDAKRMGVKSVDGHDQRLRSVHRHSAHEFDPVNIKRVEAA